MASIRIIAPEALCSGVRIFHNLSHWWTGQVILTKFMAEKIIEFYLRISLIAIFPLHGKFYHFMVKFSILPVQVWIYVMVPELGLRCRTLLHQPNIPNQKIRFGSNVRSNICSMEKSKIKSSILFRKFYLCHTSKSELFIVYDHNELDKNWTNGKPIFHFHGTSS